MRPQILINCGKAWFEFSRSKTGQLDFAGRVEPPDTNGYQELASSTYFSPAWYTFLSGDLNGTPKVFVAEDVDVSDKDSFSYLVHVGALLNAVESGDSLLAGELYLRRHSVFDRFAPLTQYILRDSAAEILFSLCFGKMNNAHPDDIPLIYEQAREQIGLDLSKNTLEQELSRWLSEGQVSLTLPLVGTGFYSWNPVPDALDRLTDNLLCVSLLERSEKIRRARQDFYEDIHVTVQAEPYNRHDKNAILVCIESLEAKLCGNPGMERAGYIRATAAEVIRRAKPKKLSFSGKIVRISDGDTVVRVTV